MDRLKLVLTAGVCAAVLGAFLVLRAGDLATRWQSIGPDAWAGTTDPELRRTYRHSRPGVALLRAGALGVGRPALPSSNRRDALAPPSGSRT